MGISVCCGPLYRSGEITQGRLQHKFCAPAWHRCRQSCCWHCRGLLQVSAQVGATSSQASPSNTACTHHSGHQEACRQHDLLSGTVTQRQPQRHSLHAQPHVAEQPPCCCEDRAGDRSHCTSTAACVEPRRLSPCHRGMCACPGKDTRGRGPHGRPPHICGARRPRPGHTAFHTASLCPHRAGCGARPHSGSCACLFQHRPLRAAHLLQMCTALVVRTDGGTDICQASSMVTLVWVQPWSVPPDSLWRAQGSMAGTNPYANPCQRS